MFPFDLSPSPQPGLCDPPVTVTNSRCREMDEQIRLMDQNLKCLSAAEEKVLTVKPREALCTARFRFCFAAASPPLVTCRVLSHLLECSILSRLSASLISSFLVAPLPLRRVSFPGAIWGPLGGASVPTSTPGSSYDSFLAVISLNCPPNWHPWAGSQPAGAPPTRAAVEGVG